MSYHRHRSSAPIISPSRNITPTQLTAVTVVNHLMRIHSDLSVIMNQVMEWVIRERPYMPKELDYSYLLEFTAKLHGISQGEKLFSHIPLEFQDALLYNNLVIACLDKGWTSSSCD